MGEDDSEDDSEEGMVGGLVESCVFGWLSNLKQMC